MEKSTKKKFKILIFFNILLLIASGSFANDSTQMVSLFSAGDTSVRSGELINIYALYNVSDNSKTTGIGIEIHYNSNFLEFIDINSKYEEGFQKGIDKLEDNSDDDHLTDRVISTAWTSYGYDTWPYLELPIELLRIKFKVRDNVQDVQTWLNVTATSTSGHGPFEGQNLQLFITSLPNIDINKDGKFNLIDIIQTFNHVGQLN